MCSAFRTSFYIAIFLSPVPISAYDFNDFVNNLSTDLVLNGQQPRTTCLLADYMPRLQ